MVDFEVIVADKETGELAVSRNAIDVIRQVTAQKKAAEKTEKELKEKHLRVYEDCLHIVNTKASVRITLK